MTSKSYTTVLKVRVQGVPLPDAVAGRLVSAWIDASVNVPAAFRLVFSDPARDLLSTFPALAVGAKAELVPYTDGTRGRPLLTGEVTALEADADGTGKSLIVRGYDPGHRLLRNRRVAGYPNMTAADIVRRLATENGLGVGTVDSTPTVYELATQPNLTDWDFLSRLARENDVRLYFDEEGRLQFTALRTASGAPADTTPAAQSPYVLEFGVNAGESRVSVTAARQVPSVSVRGWDVQTKRPLTADARATASAEILTGTTPAEVAAPFGAASLTATGVPYATQAQVRHAAEALADDVAGSFAELEIAVDGNPELRPGVPVALGGAGAPFEGKYTVTGVRHVFASRQRYTTWVQVSGRQFRSLYGLAAGPREAPALPGVVVAVVSNIKDPLRMGRVKLRFPWLSDTYESDWCRVAQFGGVRGGGLILPEVNDEVLAAFDRGSLEHPYVLAGLYNGVDKLPRIKEGSPPVDATSGTVNWRSLASRSGQAVELLDDGRRARGVRLRTGDGALTVHLDQNRTTVTVRSDGSVTIQGARGVDVKAGADLNLTAGRAVNITAGAALNLKAGGKVELAAGGAVSLDAVGTASIKAVGPVALTSAANASVTAATVTLSGLTLANGVPF
ncbi:VgrG-related protein [Streptomyces sp. NPDC101175]|uniref:VgrG-related protein n=1 Tax=Streptomyces sp. NPDC101175 TaxID=3366123 RepID=UPI0038342FE6